MIDVMLLCLPEQDVGWVKFTECSVLMYGMRFSLRLKGAVYKSYVMPSILYGSEAWC